MNRPAFNRSDAREITASISDLRRDNRDRVLGLIARLGPLGRLRLCDETGLTGAGISRITRELIQLGLVIEGTPIENKGVVGRRQALLEINPTGAYVIGATLTANRKSVALTNTMGQIIDRTEMDDLDVSIPESAVNALADAADALIERRGINRSRFLGVGVGLAVAENAGPPQSGLLSSSALGWTAVPIAQLFRDILQVPVKVEARAPAMLRAELRSFAGSADSDVLLINVGLGLGAAGYFGGEIKSAGSSGFGDLAHLSISGSSVLCHCGRRGCLDATGTGVTVLDTLNNWTQENRPSFSSLSGSLHKAVELSEQGDPAVRAAFFQAGRIMGRNIDAIATMVAPRRIILAGQTGRQSDYVEGVREAFHELRVGVMKSKEFSDITIEISNASSAEASSCVALEEFVFSRHLDIERLMSA